MGNEQGSVLDRTPINSPCEVKWSQVKLDCNVGGREGHCSASLHNKVYCYGGLCDKELYKLSVFDIDGKWSDITAVGPCPLSNATLSVVGSKLYLFGGLNKEVGWRNDLWCFDTNTQQWTELAPSGISPTPRDKHTCVVRGTSLIMLGGFGPDPGDMLEEDDEEEEPSFSFVWFNDVYVYDTVKNTWSQPPLTALDDGPVPRAAHTATLWKNFMIVFGGKDSKTRNQDLYKLDLDELEWSKFEDAGQRPLPCSFHCAVQYGQFMLVYGGRRVDNSHSKEIHVLDCESGGWYNPVFEQSESESEVSPGPRGQSTMSMLSNGKVVIIGGSVNFSLVEQCCQVFPKELYTFDCTALTSVIVPEPVPEAEEGQGSGEVGNGIKI